MKLKVSILATMLTIALAAVAAVAVPTASAKQPPVTATTQLTSATGVVNGTLSNLHVVNQAGQLLLNGTFTDTLGNVTNFSTPILGATAAGSCQILDLTLGPLDLNLLGLMVHLDTVHLNITAQSGPGNLLGNLLCGVAGLLDNGASNNAIANLLNRLLGILNL